jgi:oxygen-independent coproporphyrinogen-3 oxidase
MKGEFCAALYAIIPNFSVPIPASSPQPPAPEPFGLYVHIPFCARRCPYCDFAIHIGAKENFVARYVDALKKELRLVLANAARDQREFTSIFFGGGTPTFLREDILASLLELIFESYPVAREAEISIEANPENLSRAKLQALRDAGFNRLSLGVQSLDDDALKFLGRAHRAADVESGVLLARELGWENISLDFIYAVPHASPAQNQAAWRASLERSTHLPLQHISCYSLTIEDNTNFGKRAAAGVLLPMCDDDQAEQMQIAQEILEEAGLLRYEISNYAQPGRESSHNQNYWRGGDYLAAGCGAHGHLCGVRWWNERDAEKYVARMESADGNLAAARDGEETLTARERFDELVLLGLRTREGVHLPEVSRKLQLDARGVLKARLHELIAQNWIEENNEILRLTPRGLPLADAVAAKLLS